MDEWIAVEDETPAGGQHCKVLFEDETESEGTYLSDLGIFCLTGALTSFGPSVVTHWMPA